jgi:hypothetical protein
MSFASTKPLEALLRAHHMWTGEHASPVTRLLFEAQVFIRRMLKQGYEEVFLQYQSYGLGKRKLLKQHVKSLLERLVDEAPEMFKAYAESLEQKKAETGATSSRRSVSTAPSRA